MKIGKFNVLICLLVLTLGSCQSFLESRDKGQVLEEKLFVNQEGVEEAMYGLYFELGTGNLWGAHHPILMDCMAQYFTLGNYSKENAGGFEEVMLHHHESQRSRELFGAMWESSYKVISDINKIIENLDNWDRTPLRYMNLYRGECLGLRAFMHFELLRMYGSPDLNKRGIPYVRNYGMWVTPFSKTGECYDEILADLKEAHELLKDDEEYLTYPRQKVDAYSGFTQCRELHMNLYAVKAALARVYYTRNQGNDLDSALMYARQIVDSKKFPLPANEKVVPDHFIRMMSGTVAQDEAIFGVYKYNTYSELQSLFLLKNSSFKAADETMYQVLGDYGTDFRSNWLRVPSSSNAGTEELGLCVMKLLDATVLDPSNVKQKPIGDPGLNLIRIPEMYLMVAELLSGKDPKTALEYFNAFITSRGYRSQESFNVNDVDTQFYKEYLAEGLYWFRLRRNQVKEIKVEKILASVKGQQTIEMDEKTWTLPIPDSEFEFREEETYK